MGGGHLLGRDMPKESKIDPKVFERLCIQQVSEKEIAEYFGVDRRTVNTFCKKNFKVTFTTFSQQKRLMGRTLLVNKALKLAERNGAVMIFLLKNWCGMKDSPEDKERHDGFSEDMQQWFAKVKGRDDEGTDS